ncbi:MAG: hypothetical protein U0869_21130 [Chloroflexota bacterium]
MTARPGRVRSARLTDLAALGELSRLSHRHGDEAATDVRSLGLPVQAGHVSVFSLFRMPLGAFQPHDPLYVYEVDGRLAGLARADRDTQRDEWTIVELDAVDQGDAGDIRFRLVNHLLRDGSKRGAERFHVACADEDDNVELFMQAGFARYGEELILHRAVEEPWPDLMDEATVATLGIRPAAPLDALPLDQLYRAITPAPVARLEGYRLPDWERVPSGSRIPRSSLTPILRFADVDVIVQACPPGSAGPEELAALAQVGVAKEDQPHYLRVLCRPGFDPTDLIRYGLAIIGDRSGETKRRGHASPYRGVLTTVRTYESPLDRRLEEAGFRVVSRVSLLLKEALVRVAEPALMPAVR